MIIFRDKIHEYFGQSVWPPVTQEEFAQKQCISEPSLAHIGVQNLLRGFPPTHFCTQRQQIPGIICICCAVVRSKYTQQPQLKIFINFGNKKCMIARTFILEEKFLFHAHVFVNERIVLQSPLRNFLKASRICFLSGHMCRIVTSNPPRTIISAAVS